MAARNFASVKLKADLVDDARKEAELFNRSLGGQIEHWARVGRALEGAPQFSTERVRATLMGRLKMEELSAAERRAVLDSMFFWLGNPSAEEKDEYAALVDLPSGAARPGLKASR